MTKTVKTMKSALLAATLAISLGAVPALAGSPITQKTLDGAHVEMSIQRAYLATDAGVAKVYKALQVEVKDACEGRAHHQSTLVKQKTQKRCETKLLKELVASSDSQALWTLHLKSTAH